MLRGSRRAFTLVELMVVVVLISISAVLVMPRLFGVLQGQNLQGSAETVQSILRYTHSLALSQGLNYKLGFDTQRRKFFLESENDPLESPGEYEQVIWPRSISSKLGKGINIGFFDQSESSPVEMEEIHFFPDGSSRDSVIYVSDEEGENHFTLFLIGPSGKTVLRRGEWEDLYEER